MAMFKLRDHETLTDPVVVVAFDGWVDAGAAATNATRELAGDGKVVVEFDGDELFDYRARRPTLEIQDGRPERLTWPSLTMRSRRIGERDLLILTGAEPDFRWHQFAADLVDLNKELGVSQWLSLGAIPAAVPHTRPVPILGTASQPDLLRGGVQPGPQGLLRVPAACISIVDVAVAGTGIPTVGYFAQIPHYMSGEYPGASVNCCGSSAFTWTSSRRSGCSPRRRLRCASASTPRRPSTRTPVTTSNVSRAWPTNPGCQPVTT